MMENLLNSTNLFAAFAYINAGLWLLVLISSALFFLVSEKWGTPNDVMAVLFLVSIFPLILYFYAAMSGVSFLIRIITTLAGLVGALIPTIGQILLISRRIDFEGSKRYFPGMLGVGAWLILISILPSAHNNASLALMWAGVLTGSGIILTLALFLMDRMQHILFYIGAVFFAVGIPIWAILLGQSLKSVMS